MRRRLCEGRYLQTELPTADSLQGIEQLLGQVTWSMDGPLHLYDSISYPERVWTKKKDDCDGFAVLAAVLLRRWDPATDPALLTVMMRPYKSSHTVCAFRDGDNIRFFDNASLNDGLYQDYAGVVAKVSANADKVICWDVVDPASLQPLEFHRG